MVEELAQHLPELAGSCMAVKGLKYKREWEVRGKREAQLQSGDEWAFEVRTPHEGLILVGGELGPIEASVIFGDDDFVREIQEEGRQIRRLPADTRLGPKAGGESVPRRATRISRAQKYSSPAGTVLLESVRSGAHGGSSDDCGRGSKSRRIGAPRLE